MSQQYAIGRLLGSRLVRSMIAVLLATVVIASPLSSAAATVEELRRELEERRETLKDAEAEIARFREEIQLKKQEARTLGEQIEIIDDNVSQLELSINRTVAEIETTNTAISGVEQEIALQEEEIRLLKIKLAEYIRSLHSLDQQSTVTVFLKYTTFSEAMSEASTFTELQNRAQETLVAVQQLRDELMIKRRELQDFKVTLESLQNRQQQQQDTLSTQRNSKARILELTNAQEQQFQSLLRQSQAAHRAADADIKAIDAAIREELRKQGLGSLPAVGRLSWPIDPIFGISCVFHCAGYPYAYLIGPHAGIDVPTYVGTPIKAPADGYVARAHDSGGPGYSYILLLHGENVSTVYGHVSGFAVNEGQTVTRGTVIGYTGGAPGTRGAGLSSGPHLHFEVRVNNSPVNPQQYL